MTETPTRSIAAMQQITREYASFSQSHSGLGNVLGGMASLLSFSAMWLLGRGPVLAALTVALALAWLLGKEIIRHKLYRGFGEASEIWLPLQRRGHAITAALSPVALIALAVLPLGDTPLITPAWSIPLPYLIVCLAAPWITWRYLRTGNEMVVGFYLLLLSAVTSAGLVPDRVIFLVILPVYSLLLIVLGLKEHRQFLDMAERLRGPRALEA